MCGAIGHQGLDLFPSMTTCIGNALGHLVPNASAAETSERPSLSGVKEFSNADGDFLIMKDKPGSAAQPDSGMIGLRLTKEKDEIVAAEAFKGGPAMQAGIESGDVISSIDGRKAKGMSLDAAAKSLRGKPGTLVVLRLRQKKSGKIVKRSLIRVDDAQAQVMETDKTAVTFKEFSLKVLGSNVCPPTKDECNFLYAEKSICMYTCKSRR